MQRGFLLGATHSGAGKTTVTCGVLSGLDAPAPFKAGPDFIDPMFHRHVTGRTSRNLDTYMLSARTNRQLLSRHSGGGSVAVVEGMMGLFGGIGAGPDNHSSAHLARQLGLPIILVLDGKRQDSSLAAAVQGFVNHQPDTPIAGYILNRTSASAARYLRESISRSTSIPCCGHLPDLPQATIPERYLGLLQSEELSDLDERVDAIAKAAQETLDWEQIERISTMASIATDDRPIEDCYGGVYSGRTLALARDEAFSFYYESNLELLCAAGVRIVEFSPTHDHAVPPADYLYLGGGYPELVAEALGGNQPMIRSVREFCESGKSVYAECGGMMYLGKKIRTVDGIDWPMVGLFDYEIAMSERLNIARFGYVACTDPEGRPARGHEFHYSDFSVPADPSLPTHWQVSKASKPREWRCGYRRFGTVAGYPHLHFLSNPEIVPALFVP